MLISGYLGVVDLASNTIVTNLVGLITVAVGFMQSATTLVGHAIGNSNEPLASKLWLAHIRLAWFTIFVFFIGLNLSVPHLYCMYTPNKEIIS